MAEAGRVCLHHHTHPSGVRLFVGGSFTTSFRVVWLDAVTEQMLASWQDEQELAEYGACGIAILLMLKLTEYTVIRRAVKGEGIDYWLCRREKTFPFQDAARLEVSGILAGDDATLQSRVRAKWRQTVPTDGSLPAHIVVVEFSTPVSEYVVKP